jgi:hypothetical protein
LHINEGDYVSEKANFGALGAIGLEIGNPGSVSFFMEATYDSAKATVFNRRIRKLLDSQRV